MTSISSTNPFLKSFKATSPASDLRYCKKISRMNVFNTNICHPRLGANFKGCSHVLLEESDVRFLPPPCIREQWEDIPQSLKSTNHSCLHEKNREPSIFNLISCEYQFSNESSKILSRYDSEVIATYVFVFSFSFPLLELKCVLPGSKIVVPSDTIRSGKDIKVHTCPTMGFADLD